MPSSKQRHSIANVRPSGEDRTYLCKARLDPSIGVKGQIENVTLCRLGMARFFKSVLLAYTLSLFPGRASACARRGFYSAESSGFSSRRFTNSPYVPLLFMEIWDCVAKRYC
jgi:hypothetical protein